MSVRGVTYYQVQCDREGCPVNTGELVGYEGITAWETYEQAIEQWSDHGGTVDSDGQALCEEHQLDEGASAG